MQQHFMLPARIPALGNLVPGSRGVPEPKRCDVRGATGTDTHGDRDWLFVLAEVSLTELNVKPRVSYGQGALVWSQALLT